MKTVRYTTEALRALKRHGAVAGRIRRAIEEYGVKPGGSREQRDAFGGSIFQPDAGRRLSGDFRGDRDGTDGHQDRPAGRRL